jgi:hypothetical protein
MKMNQRLNFLLGIMAALIVASIALTSVALAADPASEPTTPATCMRNLVMSKTAEYMDAKGYEYKDAFAAARADVIDQLFKEGKITKEQMDKMLSGQGGCNGMMGGRGMMGGGGMMGGRGMCRRMNQ